MAQPSLDELYQSSVGTQQVTSKAGLSPASASSQAPAPTPQTTDTAPRPSLDDLYNQSQQPDSMMKNGVVDYVKEHPYKTVLEPAAKTITGSSLEDTAHKLAAPKESMDLENPVNYWSQVAKDAVASTIGGVADAYTTPANYALVPAAKGALNVAGKAIEGAPQGLRDASGRLYNWMVRLPTKAFQYSKDPLDVLAKEQIPGNTITELAQHAEDRLNIRSLQLNKAVQNSTQTVDLSEMVAKHLDDAASKAEGSLQDRTNMLNRLKYMGDQLQEQYGDLSNVPVQKAVQLKRQLADDFPFTSADAEGNMLAKTAHSMYHDINAAVEKAEPDIADLNHRVSGLIDITKAARNRMAVESRNNPLGLIATILGAGTAGHMSGVVGGVEGTAAGLGTAIMAKAMTSPAVLTRVAGVLANMAEVDKINLYKAAPWFMNIAQKAHEYIGNGNKMIPATEGGMAKNLEGTELSKIGELSAEPKVTKLPAEPNELTNGGPAKAMEAEGGQPGLPAAAGAGLATAANAHAKEDDQRLKLSAVNYTKQEEGFRASVYEDTTGHQTIGYGFNIDNPSTKKFIPTAVLNGERELTQEEADKIYPKVYNAARNDAIQFAGNKSWNAMSTKQQQALTDMSYNMGLAKLNGFKNLKSALQSNDWDKASKEVLKSKYAKDVPNRARRNSTLMRTT